MTEIIDPSAVFIRSSQLVTWLIKENVIARNWIDALDSLDEAKLESSRNGMESIQDETARGFLTSNQSQMMYPECKQLVQMMSIGIDGQSKTLFTRKFKSPILLSWVSILKSYEDDRLFIAEKLRAFKQASREAGSLRKQISEFGLRLAELDAKRHACAIETHTIEEQLKFMRMKFGLRDDVDAAAAIEAFLKEEYQSRAAETKKLMQAPRITQQWEEYCVLFPDFEKPSSTLELAQYRLIMEELTAFLQAAGHDLANEFAKVRDSLADTLSYDVADATSKAVAEYNRLFSTLHEDKAGHRLSEIESRFRAEIARSSERLAELTEVRQALIEDMKRDIESVTGKRVEILDD